jgi:acetylornithine/succinyldiaminopimelate/putrescine aminotransferase/predicted amino acid dehydrogenase
MQSLQQEIAKEINLALIEFKKLPLESQEETLRKLRTDLSSASSKLLMPEARKDFLFHQISNVHSIEDLISLLRDINERQVSDKPSIIALEKSYHGKTMGALALTSSEAFREPFFLDKENNKHTIFLNPHLDQESLEKIINGLRRDLLLISFTGKKIVLANHKISSIAAAFIEPIQGEAGVKVVSNSFMALMKKYSLQEHFHLIFDEIQAGMFRTGLMASGNHADITADVYTFSKSLGGGIAKIAATTIIARKYIEEFGFLHTSTFSEDDFSSSLGLEVLNILTGSESPLAAGMKSADYLEARLNWLQSLYPEVIKEIRGRGLMLAIEFNDSFKEFGFEFKTICDAKMQGYLMASGLLNHENLRMNPSLSNNLTLRIQPSLFFDIVQTEELIVGLINLCAAMKNKNIKYFLSAIYPGQEIINERTKDIVTEVELGKRPLSVFLCHLIDEGHIKKVTKSMDLVPGSVLLHKLALGKDLTEFQIYHSQTLKDKSGKEMDIILMGIPVTSEELKKSFLSRNKHKIVQKVQNAVDYAKSLGASTVGLGQFTSIVSGNGLYLDPKGMNLTTGNAYTISLTVQSALRSAQEKNLKLETSTAAIIGAAGNIMSVASSLMADHMGKLILVHHSPVDSSLKYQEAIKRILSDILKSSAQNKLTKTIQSLWTSESRLVEFLNLPEIKEVLLVTSDLNSIKEADIVMSGASASTGFLTLDLFKHNAVIVDVAVPPSIKPDLLASLEKERSDLTYHLGGVASLPQDQSINFFVFPLGHNESYACMAETFSIGFSDKKNFLNIGDLDKQIVQEVESIAANVGFTLGRSKDKSSL